MGKPKSAMNAYARRRVMIEDAFRTTPDVRELSNNEVARLLSVGVGSVRFIRRTLESLGAIPEVRYRLGRRGSFVDVRRVCEPPWKKELASAVVGSL